MNGQQSIRGAKTAAFVQKCPWVILAAGAAIQILTGIPASWGVFQRSVCEEYAFSQDEASMIFSLTICFFGIGCILGGYLQDKAGPRIAGFSGTAMLAAGFCAAAFLPAQVPWAFYAAFSIPVGMGSAFLYPAVMTSAQKWFAQRKGFATGVIGGAVGFSGGVLTLLGRFLIGNWGVRTAFFVLGILMLLVCGAGSCLLCDPPQAQQTQAAAQQGHDYTVKEMLATRQYKLMLFIVCFATPAVLLFSPLIVEIAQERGLDETAALSCIVVGSFGSAAGRLLMPWISDKIGRRCADMILFGALCGLSVAFIFAQGWWVVAVYSLLTFCYSGEAAMIPVIGTDLFGRKNAGVNYGFLALGMSVGSVGFPLLARCFEGLFFRHIIAVAAAALGFICLCFLKPTHGEKL